MAATAAAEVAADAAITAQAAVDAACAAAAKAAQRAREVAADAAAAVAAVAAEKQGGPQAAPARPGLRASVTGPRRSRVGRPAPDDNATRGVAAAQAAAQHVARRVELVAEAAATAATDAALVIAVQVQTDATAAAADVAAHSVPLGQGLAKERRQARARDRHAPPAAEASVEAATIRYLHRHGSSPHTIAAKLNSVGSRTYRDLRWSSRSVAEMLRLFPLTADELAGERRTPHQTDQLLKIAEDGLARAEQGLAEAQRLGGLGGWSWNLASNEVTWSQEMYRLYGVEAATFSATYEGFLACVHPDDRDTVEANVGAVFDGAPGYEFDHRVVHGNGDVLWLHARGAAVRDEAGAPVRLYGTVIDKTESKRAEQRDHQHSRDLARLAWHDGLTGLANRSLLHDRLAHALSRRGQTVSVLLLDLDDFKSVNDTSGHAAGDRLLIHVANRLLTSARGGDTVARLGGDEFAIVVEEADPGELAERILDALTEPVLVDGRLVTPAASIGIATSDGIATGDALLMRADVAMYAAKSAGKGRAEWFDSAMAERVKLRTDLLDGLRQAVPRGEIIVHYQAIIDVAKQAPSRFEALVRWQRHTGLVSPAEFLPLAEETGLIVDIGGEVLRQTCEQLHDWLAQDPARSVSVNVSPLQLQAEDFAERTLRLLAEAEVSPTQLVLEVTETLFLNTTPALIDQLDSLRRHGIAVSIDDFGTGYSSLGRLHKLPVDSIKIDKSFIDLIDQGDEQLPIITSMIAMAHALGLDVTAEGVETANQAARLKALGCDYLQGFHFARPAPAAAATGPSCQQAMIAWRALDGTSGT